MPTAKDSLVDDVDFILRECVRYLKLQKEWFETKVAPGALREGYLWGIPHPTDPKQKIPCGRAGIQRLEKLALVAAQRAGIDKQVSIVTVRTPLAKAIWRKFVLEGRALDSQQVERSMSEAARAAKKTLETITHYIPCHLMLANRPDNFSLGPIMFMRQPIFRQMIASSLRGNKQKYLRSYRFIHDATQYYKTFGWVAVVTVPDCDETTSENVANAAIICALNCFHLIFGPGYTSRMVVGGPAIWRDKRGTLILKDGELSCSTSYGGPGEVGFDDDWQQLLADSQAQFILHLCGVALEAAANPKLDRPISQRFLDAAAWYGEAAREVSRAAKVVKYVTALERMLMTDEHDNIADTVSERVAAFCFDPFVTDDFERLKKEAQRAYTIRSKLVHGSMSQNDLQVFDGIGIGFKIGRNAILNALMSLGHSGLQAEKISQKQLAQWFGNIVSQALSERNSFNEMGAYI